MFFMRRGQCRTRKPAPIRCLELEVLEDRTLPATTVWSTYLAVDAQSPRQIVGHHSSQSVAVDSHGYSVITGSTFDGQEHFPAFVEKVDPTGVLNANDPLTWQVSLGGLTQGISTVGYGVAVDKDANVLVVGQTFGDLGSGGQCFIYKLSSIGTPLWKTVIAGSGPGYGIAVDGAGNAYVVGDVFQSGLSLATNPYPGDPGCAFVAKIDPAGNELWATYVGGISAGGNAVALDSTGAAFVAGEDGDGFVEKVDTSGLMKWIVHLGSGNSTAATAVAVDSQGNALVTGAVEANTLVGQSVLNQPHPNIDRSGDAFVSKVGGDGTILWARYLGGSSYDVATGIAVAGSDNAWVTGQTGSTDFDTAIPLKTGTGTDAFVAAVDSNGTLLSANYLGADKDTAVGGIAIAPFKDTLADGDGNWRSGLSPAGMVVVAGSTLSTALPNTTNAFNAGKGYSAFVSEFGIPYFNQGNFAAYTYDTSGINPNTGLPFSIRKLGCSLSSLTMILDYELQLNLSPSQIDILLVGLGNANGVGGGFDLGTYLNTDIRADDVDFPDATTAIINSLTASGMPSRQNFDWQDLAANDPTPATTLTNLVQKGVPVIVQVHPPGHNHYVVVTGKNGNRFTMYDPGDRTAQYLDEYPSFTLRGYVRDPDDHRFVTVRISGPDSNLSLLVTDPQGNKTGIDPNGGNLLGNIPNSFYYSEYLQDNDTGENIHHSQYVDAYLPQQGQYTIVVATAATTPEPFDFTVQGITSEGALGNNTTFQGTVNPGQPVTLQFDLDPSLGQTQQTPSISGLVPSPSSVMRGGKLTLTATGVFGQASAVKFFQDSDQNGVFDPNVDQLIGEGTQSGTDWSLPVLTDSFPLGLNEFFARAEDASGTVFSSAVASPLVNVSDLQPTVLAFTTSVQTLTAGQPSAIVTIQLKDQAGGVASAGSGGVTLTLSSNSSAGTFLDTNGKPLSGNNLPIPEGSSTASFEYEDTKAGTPTLTAAATGFADAIQQETVQAASADHLTLKGPGAASAGGKFTVTATAVDPFGNTDTKYDGSASLALSAKLVNLKGVVLASNANTPLGSANGLVFFVKGQDELWKTDGSATGTVLVKKVSLGIQTSLIGTYFFNVNGTLFFVVVDPFEGTQLWKSDGTAAGTVEVKAIAGMSDGINDRRDSYLVISGVLYFAAEDSKNNEYLWRSDGTATGTYVVKQWGSNIGSGASFPFEFRSANGKLFFTLNDGLHDDSLWVSDGTTSGTKILLPGTTVYANYLTSAGSKLFFQGDDAYSPTEINSGLWITDGTTAGTVHINSVKAHSLGTMLNGIDYFSYDDGVHGTELWKSDGTAGGTEMVADILPGVGSSFPQQLTAVGDKLFFVAQDRFHGYQIWKSDGTATGTTLVGVILPGNTDPSRLHNLTDYNRHLFFTASNGFNQMWISDGTAAGTAIIPLSGSSRGVFTVSDPTIIGGNLFIGTGVGLVKVFPNSAGKLFGGKILSFVNGVATFTGLSVNLVGSYSLSAGSGSLRGATSAITVTAGIAVRLRVSGFPTTDISGAVHNFTVTAVDAYGNAATSYRGTIHFTSSDPLAGLPKDFTFTAANKGTHTFKATLKSKGRQNLTATDKAKPKIAGRQSGINVVSGPHSVNMAQVPIAGNTDADAKLSALLALAAEWGRPNGDSSDET